MQHQLKRDFHAGALYSAESVTGKAEVIPTI